MDRNAVLVVPADGPLKPKERSEHLLDLMKALSLAKDFIVELGNTEISETVKLNLGHVASIFSPNNRRRPNPKEEIADFKSLYMGKGGEVINPTAATTKTLKETSLPPRYPPDQRKRKREYPISDVTSDSRKDLEARLARMEACLAETQSRLFKTEARVAELEASREEYGAEEAGREEYGEQELLNKVDQLLDDFVCSDRLENMVEHLVEQHMSHLNVDMDDIFAEKEGKFDELIEGVIEGVKHDVKKDCNEIVRYHLAKLIDVRLELSFTEKSSS